MLLYSLNTSVERHLTEIMILHLPDPKTARQWCESQRWDGQNIGYVPTMGALHEGHLSLVRRSLIENDVTCVSIFVNPLQFDDSEDLKRYPNDLRADVEMLDAIGCDMVYVGELYEFFPEISSIEDIAMEKAGAAGHGLEGDHRPGHLDGVRTIVSRLFQTVGPCRAYFGEKDFQQTLVVRELAKQLGYPQIVVCPVSRTVTGLARSSRNVRLTDTQRQQATIIYRALVSARQRWDNGERNAGQLQRAMESVLASAEGEIDDFEVEYAEVRDPENWSKVSPSGQLPRAQALVAARLGSVRLIDNMRLDLTSSATDTRKIDEAACTDRLQAV